MLPDEERSEWREFHRIGDEDPLLLLWETLPMWTPKQRDAIVVALRNWCMRQIAVSNVLSWFTGSSRRVGVRIACAVARTALAHNVFSPDDSMASQRLAVDTAERWVRGEASVEDCRNADDIPAGVTPTSPCYAALRMVYMDRAREDASRVGALAAVAPHIVLKMQEIAGDQGASKELHRRYGETSSKLCEVAASAVATALEDAAIGYERAAA